MLQNIWVKNFALIKELNLDFSSGYTVVTGETGSGKSIFLGALNLILGERADFSVIGPHAEKAVVEAEFDCSNRDLKNWFQFNEIDEQNPVLIRREISKQGRSRAFVNDTPVSLAQMKSLVEQLIYIHSQHNTLSLKDKNFHLDLLDTLAGTVDKVKVYRQKFQTLQQLKKLCLSLRESITKANADRDYIEFQLAELEELKLDSTQYDILESELEILENIDQIQAGYLTLSEGLDSENGVLDQLRVIHSTLDKSSTVDTETRELLIRLKGSLVELEDILVESQNALQKLEKDPEKIQQITERLDAYNRVLTKHRCQSQAELQAKEEEWQLQLTHAKIGEEELEQKEKELAALEQELWSLAKTLHEVRAKSSPTIEKAIHALLVDLKMPDTQIRFELEKSGHLKESGCTETEFLFCPNKGMGWQAIDKAASGGELSRVMLAIQCLVSERKQLASILFDEIDTGVSGEVAQKIGRLLRRMGENMQLIAISHLPQVASKAQAHIKVSKFLVGDTVETQMNYLSEENRINEIARLMSGENISHSAVENAKNLIEER